MSAFNGAHTTFPMLGMPIAEFAKDKDGKNRDIVMIVDEAILNECAEPRQMVWFADVTVENRPMMISSYTVPEASGSFCERGGRFGSHSSNESMAPVFYKKMAFIAFFNAGVRALDIRDPYHPMEVGYFIPSITAATDKRCVKIDGKDRCKVAIQTNNVETDERGYIYIVDRANTGLHILELTGPARAVAGLPVRTPGCAAGRSLRRPSWRSARCRASRPMSMRRRARRTERTWQEIAWPFPRDGWPAGQAFRCGVAACGGEVELYVRPKIGFCNCDPGVADDDEVDRVADLDLMSERFAPREPGHVVRVADMPGRIRAYDLNMSDGSRHTAIGIAVSRRCDLLVAVAHGKGDAPEVRRAALEFLASSEMTRWMMAAMEGR